MRGSHHIVAGLAMLGIGRAAILMGESADDKQRHTNCDADVPVLIIAHKQMMNPRAP